MNLVSGDAVLAYSKEGKTLLIGISNQIRRDGIVANRRQCRKINRGSQIENEDRKTLPTDPQLSILNVLLFTERHRKNPGHHQCGAGELTRVNFRCGAP